MCDVRLYKRSRFYDLNACSLKLARLTKTASAKKRVKRSKLFQELLSFSLLTPCWRTASSPAVLSASSACTRWCAASSRRWYRFAWASACTYNWGIFPGGSYWVEPAPRRMAASLDWSSLSSGNLKISQRGIVTMPAAFTLSFIRWIVLDHSNVIGYDTLEQCLLSDVGQPFTTSLS